MTIIETQNPIGNEKEGKVRVYEINGPQDETITSFWDYLKANRIIQDYRVQA